MIKNILFDLGGVLYKVDYRETAQKLADIFSATMEFSQEKELSVIAEYEKGNISTDVFRQEISSAFHYEGNVENTQFDHAWNVMLKGFYDYTEPMLNTLTQKGYNIAILSNINKLHLEHIHNEFPAIFSVLHHCFFSCNIGHRKPESSCFHYVLDECGWNPKETLFVDDALRHCKAAALEHIHTLHWQSAPYSVQEVLSILLEAIENHD